MDFYKKTDKSVFFVCEIIIINKNCSLGDRLKNCHHSDVTQ